MAQQFTVSLAQLDTLAQAVNDYLAVTVTKCDSPEIRAARTALIQANVPIEVDCFLVKSSIKLTITVPETVV